jgi:hypothetical protein
MTIDGMLRNKIIEAPKYRQSAIKGKYRPKKYQHYVASESLRRNWIRGQNSFICSLRGRNFGIWFQAINIGECCERS